MKAFDECCAEYRAARKALHEHLSSAFRQESLQADAKHRLQQYLDLEFWPASPLLVGLTPEDREKLTVWGKEFTAKLNQYHERSKALRSELMLTLQVALEALGAEAAPLFQSLAGPFDTRCSTVVAQCGEKRAQKLDGIDCVLITDDPSSFFSKGFFKATKLKAREFMKDAALVRAYREGSFVAKADLERLGRLVLAS